MVCDMCSGYVVNHGVWQKWICVLEGATFENTAPNSENKKHRKNCSLSLPCSNTQLGKPLLHQVTWFQLYQQQGAKLQCLLKFRRVAREKLHVSETNGSTENG